MRLTTISIWQRVGLSIAMGMLGLMLWGTSTWASTRIGDDLEFQAWFRTRNTFQTDGKEHFDWVQWRNEGFVWFIDNGLVKKGTLQGTGISIPFVEDAQLSARFRLRVDPVYYLRDHYKHIYDSDHQKDFAVPERDFRDLYVDLSHGEVGPGRLTTRWGYQQIVWGESDLYRSLDIINPLRIDQNFSIGEKFDEFRYPILAVKSFYDIGNVGESFSNVGIESFYSPRWTTTNHNLLLENGWRIEQQERGCVGPGGEFVAYSPENCAHAKYFMPMRPPWLGNRRMANPWSLFRVGPVARTESPDFACARQRCAPDVAGDRTSIIYDIMKGNGTHHGRGTNLGLNNAAGARIVGTTWFGAQFSLNYIWLPTIWGDGGEFPNKPASLVYSDNPADNPAGSFEEGLRQCLSESGKSSTRKTRSPASSITLKGADLLGYNWPTRRLDAKGNPLPSADQPQAARTDSTICAFTPKHTYRQTHVIGFSGTYNDFDYTGAVLRMEESLSTSEFMNRYPASYGIAHADSKGRTLFHPQPVWRSMIGFDLFQALSHYPGMGWTRHMPGDIGTQASFLSFQYLMKYNPATSNTFCTWNNAVGIGPSAPADLATGPARPAQSGCRENHWNHFFTLGFSGQGYFKSKLEQRLAIAFEPRGQQWLLYGQWWWRNFYSLPVDLSMGTSWFPSSRFDNSWTILNYFTNRNLLWFEATYYIL